MRSDDDPPAALAPQPGLQHLERLIAQVGEASVPVTLRVEGDRRNLSPGVDLSAYGIAREGLAHALEHAHRAQAEVIVRYADERVELEIADCERVAVYGGTIGAGLRAEGGFVVQAQLPVEARA